VSCLGLNWMMFRVLYEQNFLKPGAHPACERPQVRPKFRWIDGSCENTQLPGADLASWPVMARKFLYPSKTHRSIEILGATLRPLTRGGVRPGLRKVLFIQHPEHQSNSNPDQEQRYAPLCGGGGCKGGAKCPLCCGCIRDAIVIVMWLSRWRMDGYKAALLNFLHPPKLSLLHPTMS